MATRPFGGRKLITKVQKSSRKSDCPFGVNRGPVSAQKRDVAEFEDCRRRSFMERMKDVFCTISFRSEPTIGEEDLKRCYDTQMPGNAEANHGIGYSVVEKKRLELIQNLVPHCYEHIQNFHHYRSDMEKLGSGCKVLYLSAGDDGIGKREKVLRRVYGQNSARAEQYGPQTQRYGLGRPRHFQAPCKPKTTKATMVARSHKESQKVTTKKNRNPNRNGQPQDDYSRASSSDNDFKSCSSNTTELKVNSAGKRQVDASVTESDEMPSFMLEQATSDHQTAEGQSSCHSLSSDTVPKPPVTTPNDMSQKSSVRTLLFESGEVLAKSNGNVASLRNTRNRDSNHSPHYLAPFHSRFPHLKQSPESISFNQMRQKRTDKDMIPPWQQYRVLCDAFRPTMSPERFSRQNGYRKPKYATATELEYYIDIVSETNSNSSMNLS